MNKIYNFQSKLLSKKQLIEGIFELKYTVPETFIYTPGQFVGARVTPTHTRAYSIVDVTDNVLTLLIDIKPQGKASIYFEKVEVGAETNLLGPYGIYKEKDTDLPKVFISTGTGIAPFIPIISKLVESKPNVQLFNFFGLKYMQNDIAYRYFEKLLNTNCKYINCVSREDISTSTAEEFRELKSGRVTQVIPKYSFDWHNTEFYICGGPEMVNEMSSVLSTLGADKIFVEKY